MSITVSVSVPATARRSASVSRTAPLADCTRLTVTTSKSAAAATNSVGASSVIVTPRPACAANGKLVLVNSPANVATVLPSGTAAATSPSTAETVPPMATRSDGPPDQCGVCGAARLHILVEQRDLHRPGVPLIDAVL